MSILQLATLLAIAATALFFFLYGGLLLAFEREGRNKPKPKRDLVGRTLISNAKAAFIVGQAGIAFVLWFDIFA